MREFLISTYEKALVQWDIDGFKLDFIDSFRFDGKTPPSGGLCGAGTSNPCRKR